MSGSEYRPSIVDGLPARVSGPWAQEKLAYLSKYMSIFNVGMKNKWRRVYLDLLAGPGRCVEDDSGIEFDGPHLSRSSATYLSPRPFLSREMPSLRMLYVTVSDPILR